MYYPRIAVLVELLDVMNDGDEYYRDSMVEYLIDTLSIDGNQDGSPSRIIRHIFRLFGKKGILFLNEQDTAVPTITLVDRVAAEELLRQLRQNVLDRVLEGTFS